MNDLRRVTPASRGWSSGRGSLCAFSVVLCLLAAPAGADCLTAMGRATVVAVPSAEAVALSDGRTLRLADVRGADPEAMREALKAFVGRAGAVMVAAGAADRWGRVVGDVTLDPPQPDVAKNDTILSVRAAMVARGLALIDPVDMSVPCLAELFGVERTAEAGRQGVWATTPTLAATGDGLAQGEGRYVLVDGTVASVGETKQTVYLNFGANWRTDFTAQIRRQDAGEWGLDLGSLSGQRVRIRGVLEAWNGGLIRIEHPAQVERVQDAP